MSHPDSTANLDQAIERYNERVERRRCRHHHVDVLPRTWSSSNQTAASAWRATRCAITSLDLPDLARPHPSRPGGLYVRDGLVVQEWTATAD